MTGAPFTHLHIFTATRRDQVPAQLQRWLSVDGSVPGAALCLDHHVTGERINLDAMPDVLDASGFDGLCTTQADADAMASMVAVVMGGRAALPPHARAVLECASHWCDHLGPHAGHSAEANATGKGLWHAFNTSLRGVKTPESAAPLAAFVLDLVGRIQRNAPWPSGEDDPAEVARAARLSSEGRLHVDGPVALVDLRGLERIPPHHVYALHRCPVSVTVDAHPLGGLRYTVGVNPYLVDAPTSLLPALHAVAAAEFAHGPPVLGALPVAGNENWGGRAAVFGSPFNHGSRLTPEDVRRVVGDALGLGGRT